jgi:hypothetical protein
MDRNMGARDWRHGEKRNRGGLRIEREATCISNYTSGARALPTRAVWRRLGVLIRR